MMASRLRVGRDVPWVTSWSEETFLGVRPCPLAGGRPAVHQAERPGVGRPNYSRNHLNRQRRSVAGMLCPMCGRPTAARDRWTQTGTLAAAGALRAKGLGRLLPAASVVPDTQLVLDAGNIAPSHRACAELALTQCPHLSTAAEKGLKPFPERWLAAPLWIEASPPPPAVGRSVAVVSFLQLYGLTPLHDPHWSRRPRPAGED